MHRFKLLYFVIFIINLYKIYAQISDKRLCVDEECKVPISHAKTLLRYSSPDSRILSFAPNLEVTIYSKSAGSREDLWGGEINGKRGYVPKHMVRETKILKKPTILVDTEFANDTETKQVPSRVEPDKVQEPYEVVDGTTIYLSPQEVISPSSTDSPIQSTALPVETNKITETDVSSETTPNDEVLKTEPSVAQDQESGEELKSSSQTENLTSQDTESDVNGEDKQEVAVEDDTSSFDTESVDEDDETDDDDDDEGDEIDDDEDEEVNDEEKESIKTEKQPEDIGTKDETVVNKDNLELENDIQIDSEAHKENLETNTEVPSTLQSEAVTAEADADLSKEISEKNSSNDEIKSEEVPPPLVNEPVEKAKTENGNLKSNIDSTELPLSSTVGAEDETNEDVSNGTVNTDDLVVSPDIETTTLSAEIEVPQPFDDSFDEVTPNPLEVTEESTAAKETISALPPLGLFAGVKPDSSSPSYIKEEKLHEKDTGASPDSSVSPVQEEELHQEKVLQETVEPTEAIVSQDVVLEEAAEKEQNVSEEIVKSGESDSSHESVVEEIKEKDDSSEESIEHLTEWSFEENSRLTGKEEIEQNQSAGFFASVMSFFASGSEGSEKEESAVEKEELTSLHVPLSEEKHNDDLHSASSVEPFCDATSCPKSAENEAPFGNIGMDFFSFNSDIFLYLVTTAISVIIFLFGYIALDKSKREGPLIAKINKLEKQLLIIVKENQILQEKLSTDSGYENNDRVSNEVVDSLKQELLEMSHIKNALEEQVQSLEKELENSTEVGMELNRMLSEILRSESGSDVLKANVENLQRQLVEQQATINSVNDTLAVTNTENHELRLELELSNKKVLDLQAELDKLLLNILKIEEEKDAQQSTLESEMANLRQRYEEVNNKLRLKEEDHHNELKQLQSRLEQANRKLELKSKEHDVLTDTLKQLKSMKNNEATLKKLLEVSGTKAEYQLLKTENQRLTERLQREQDLKLSYEKKAQTASEEIRHLQEKYDNADKLRVEAQTKLEVLSNYFKDREAQWQKEFSKHEALWAEREGEATSTTERIKFMQEQLQNYKAQTESLKQEIMSQEIELKSQISVLEKKAHENWVSARQAERKLEEAKQEAAQLRHRLTLRERAIQEDKSQRLQSPIEQNGDMPLESPASPPLLFGTRDHITKSPLLSGLPPFLPPPPGVPFMPPPIHGVPSFIPPPPPNMFPGDHRPPPLGRMSSPPLNSRYSPSSRGYSPYDRNSSSPSDSEYGTSPPHHRGYSPFNNRLDDRRDYKRPKAPRNNGRNLIKGGGSSGSGNSNESLEKVSRQQSKV